MATTLADLAPNPQNPRQITDAKKAMLAKTLAKFGDLGGIVLNRTSGVLVGGHQRVAAFAGALDASVVVERAYDPPTENGTVAEGYVIAMGERFAYREVRWDADTEKAANLAANKGAGSFDLPQVGEWIRDLEAAEFELDLTMFDQDERAELFGMPEVELLPDGQGEEEELVVPAEPKSKRGDVYQLGEHRVMCGSSAEFSDVEKLMDGAKADMIFTDPPYNVAGKLIASGIRENYVRLDNSAWDHGFQFEDVEQNMLAVLAEDATVYVCTSHHLFGAIMAWMASWAKYHGYCVWSKSNPMPSLAKRHYTFNSELIAYATRGKHTFNFPDEGNTPSVWTMAKTRHNDLHPTMKPIEVPAHAIRHSSKKGDLVVDFFGGAGSTLMACHELGRWCYTMELDPRYVDTILTRWCKATGEEAVLVSEDMGPPSNNMAKERNNA